MSTAAKAGLVAVSTASFVSITAYAFVLATAPVRPGFTALDVATSPGLLVGPVLEGALGVVLVATWVPVAAVALYRLVAELAVSRTRGGVDP